MTEKDTTKKDEAKEAAPTVYTYPDGSQRVGTPPFPKLSPKEEADQAANEPGPGATPMYVPKGFKTEGEAAPAAATTLTADQFKAKVEQQVESDVAAGKDPNTPNNTTSSDKPELVGTVPVEDGVEGLDPSDPKDLDKLAKGVKPDVKATDEQIRAAAVQVARETKGVITTKTDTKSKK